MLPPIVAKTPIAAKTSDPKGFPVLGNLIKSSFLFSSLFELLSGSDISGLSVLISSIVGSIGLFTSIDGFSC